MIIFCKSKLRCYEENRYIKEEREICGYGYVLINFIIEEFCVRMWNGVIWCIFMKMSILIWRVIIIFILVVVFLVIIRRKNYLEI